MIDLVKKALNAKRESKSIEFKESLDVTKQGEWCEIIKDVVAIANSGGGVILLGVDNQGNPNGFDVNPFIAFDTADITNKIHKYTGLQFSEFEILERKKSGYKIAAMVIEGVSIPIVFTKPGTYDIGGGKQKTAFGIGTVYFRHGAKSDPGNTEDIRKAIERQLESIRKEWIKGVRKVVTAPQGAKVVVAASNVKESTSPDAIPIRIVDDPKAPSYRKINYDETHPYRMKELTQRLKTELENNDIINSRIILCLRRLYNLEEKSDFCYKPTFGSLQYSELLVKWIVEQLSLNPNFLKEAKEKCFDKRFELGLVNKSKKKALLS